MTSKMTSYGVLMGWHSPSLLEAMHEDADVEAARLRLVAAGATEEQSERVVDMARATAATSHESTLTVLARLERLAKEGSLDFERFGTQP